MIITKNGITIRLNVASLRVMGRATQGVRLINVQDNDAIAAVTKVDHEEDEEVVPGVEDSKPENEGGEDAPQTENTEGWTG